MLKIEVYKKELAKLQKIFEGVEENKKELVAGLIEDAAFLLSENTVLRESLAETGMVKIHPSNPNLQKNVPAAGQYLKNINSYAVIIKTLNGILQKNEIEKEDEFDSFMRGEIQNE